MWGVPARSRRVRLIPEIASRRGAPPRPRRSGPSNKIQLCRKSRVHEPRLPERCIVPRRGVPVAQRETTGSTSALDLLKLVAEAATVFAALAFAAGWSYVSAYFQAFGL